MHRRLLVGLALARCAGHAPRDLRGAEAALCAIAPHYGLAGEVVETLAQPSVARACGQLLEAMSGAALRGAWRDPASAGWLHEAFTEVDRAALDRRILRGHRVDASGLATKTQVFTEAWMARWLVENTLAPIAVALGHAPPADWRARVERPARALPGLGLAELRLLDPACGAGHLLLPALDALVALHRSEDARHGRRRSDAAVVEHVLLHNVAGIDIDPDVAELCCAALSLRARQLAPSLPALRPAVVAPREPASLAGRLGALVAPQEAAAEPLGAMLEPRSWHVVLANPPWLSSRKTAIPELDAAYPLARADLYACFVERALELVVRDGLVGLVTQHGWMFLHRFEALRCRLLERDATLEVCAHLGRGGGFAAWADFDKVMQTALVVLRQGARPDTETAWFRLDALTNRDKARALVGGRPTHRRAVATLRELPGWPLVYWWDDALLERYRRAPPLGQVAPVKQGMATADNRRFVRRPWELPPDAVFVERALDDVAPAPERLARYAWVPYVKGAAGKRWLEPLDHVVRWADGGAELRASPRAVLRNEAYYFRAGVAFTYIGSEFGARRHRFRSAFDVAGSSVFLERAAEAACLMNSRAGRDVLESLNPTVNFQVGDVERLPWWPEPQAEAIYAVLEAAFAEHEAAREPSVEFVRPGPSRWLAAQAWAQCAVDRPAHAPLPPFDPGPPVPAAPAAELSFALGVALGRFVPGGGVARDAAPAAWALPDGILFLSESAPRLDALQHDACAPLRAAWRAHGQALGAADDSLAALRRWLVRDFFRGVHLPMYERCPIVLPIASADGGRSALALVSIHRWQPDTLERLLAQHVLPALQLAPTAALEALAGHLEACSRRGPPPAEPGGTPREVDAAFRWVHDDGVLPNAAALWPLLDPLWDAPRKAWAALASGQGRDAATWSHTAARYFPRRASASGSSTRRTPPGDV